jgi:hypothetical protein
MFSTNLYLSFGAGEESDDSFFSQVKNGAGFD